MSNNSPALLAVRATEWDKKYEAKLREALREHPVIMDWLVDAQADAVEDFVARKVEFSEPAQTTAIINAYAKGRTSVLMELIGTAQLLLKQPAVGDE